MTGVVIPYHGRDQFGVQRKLGFVLRLHSEDVRYDFVHEGPANADQLDPEYHWNDSMTTMALLQEKSLTTGLVQSKAFSPLNLCRF